MKTISYQKTWNQHHQEHNVEQSQDLISQKIEDQNSKTNQLIQDNNKLFLETSILNSQINKLREQHQSQKIQTNQGNI